MPKAPLVHLQFRRFAGCPICSLHLRSFARRHDELQKAGITEVVVFHSPLEELRAYHEQLPFAVIGDPEKEIYRQYGVEKSILGAMHPKAMFSAMVGMVSVPSNPLVGKGGKFGSPADFLIDEKGVILELKYGAHPDDHWEVSEVLDLAGKHGSAVAQGASAADRAVEQAADSLAGEGAPIQ